MRAPYKSRFLGLASIGGLLTAGGLAGLYRAGEFATGEVRMIIACVSLGLGLVCLALAFTQRR